MNVDIAYSNSDNRQWKVERSSYGCLQPLQELRIPQGFHGLHNIIWRLHDWYHPTLKIDGKIYFSDTTNRLLTLWVSVRPDLPTQSVSIWQAGNETRQSTFIQMGPLRVVNVVMKSLPNNTTRVGDPFIWRHPRSRLSKLFVLQSV